MTDTRLTLTADEQTTLEMITDRVPGLVAALDEHISRRTERIVTTFRGTITMEREADALLSKLMERVVAEAAPWRRVPTRGDELVSAMVNLITRHLIGQAREGIVRRLMAGKQN